MTRFICRSAFAAMIRFNRPSHYRGVMRTMSGSIAKRTRSQLQLPDEDEEEEDYHPYTPSDGTQCDYHPMKISQVESHSAKFVVPLNVNPTIDSIQEMFLPHQFIKTMVIP